MRTDILNHREDILKWIQEHQSKAFICKQLQCKPATLESYLKKMNIEYAGNQSGKGIKKDNSYIPASEYIHSTCVRSSVLKDKLIREGIKPNHCEICGISEWQGQKIVLELHHKDCNHFNNNFDNLMVLCPNCHSIQPGNAGKNCNYYNKD